MQLPTRLRATPKAFQDGARVVFRALGLNVIVSGLRSVRHLTVGKGYDEPIKVALRKSRTTALLRAIIHIVPLGVALWENIMNWSTYYVGESIRSQAYYQFGAKLHEMTAQASLAAILFSYIRYELSLGLGLPFGALFSGLQVSQASYLWSMEFCGAVCATYLPIYRKLGIIFVTTIAIVLAATVGPSSAILLTPRLGYWPAGSTDIWLNATLQSIWPDSTNGLLVSNSCLILDPIASNDDCPSSDWQGIQKLLSLTAASTLLEDQKYFGPVSPSAVEITGKSSLRQLSIALQSSVNIGPGWDLYTNTATSQQAAVADALTKTGILWNIAMSNTSTKGHGSVLSQLDAVHSITTGYYQPHTSVYCEYDVIRGENDTDPVAFPPPPGSEVQMLNTAEFNTSRLPGYAFVFPNITRSQILETPGPRSENRLRWVKLPQDPFNGTAIGAIVLLSQRSSLNTTQEMLICNIGAGWGLSTVNTSTVGGGATTVHSEVDTSILLHPEPDDRNNSKYSTDMSQSEVLAAARKGPFFELPLFPQRPILLTEEWANYLNPVVPYLNTTVFNSLLVNSLLVLDDSPRSAPVLAQMILAGMVANGLSKIGATSQLQGAVRQVVQSDGSFDLDGNYWFSGKGNNVFQIDPAEAKDWVKFRVSSTVESYAYNTHGSTTKVAISFLLAYCVVAVAHILYAGISGISSTCWDSIAEVTALAVNTTPTAALRNTCAGITEMNIFKLPVRVLAMRDAEGDGEHLELVFGNVDEKTVESRTIKADRAYGTMPSLKPHAKML